MANKNVILKDKSSNSLFPKTFDYNIYNSSDVSLDNVLYPIGSIYISTVDVSPASFFGGTWERIEDVFLLGAGDISAGTNGGEAAHTLTTSEIPSHSHQEIQAGPNYLSEYVYKYENQTGSARGNEDKGSWVTNSGYYVSTGNTGGGTSHNNMPPYLAVYMWKRTA